MYTKVSFRIHIRGYMYTNRKIIYMCINNLEDLTVDLTYINIKRFGDESNSMYFCSVINERLHYKIT